VNSFQIGSLFPLPSPPCCLVLLQAYLRLTLLLVLVLLAREDIFRCVYRSGFSFLNVVVSTANFRPHQNLSSDLELSLFSSAASRTF
jgi:hypothetical protein